jgi:hypothetical protein
MSSHMQCVRPEWGCTWAQALACDCWAELFLAVLKTGANKAHQLGFLAEERCGCNLCPVQCLSFPPIFILRDPSVFLLHLDTAALWTTDWRSSSLEAACYGCYSNPFSLWVPQMLELPEPRTKQVVFPSQQFWTVGTWHCWWACQAASHPIPARAAW